MKRVRTSLFFMAVLGVLALGGSAWGVESSESIQGLISHWKFDEGEGTIAYDSAGTNHGLIQGATWTTGQIGGALDFDGVNDYVDLGNDSSLKPPLPVTLSAWIRFSQNHAIFVSLDDFSYRYYGVWVNVNHENHLAVGFGDGTGWGSSSYRRSKVGTTVLNADTWYHVAAVVRGATDMDLYVNGADDGGTYSGSGGSLAYSSGSASIGTAHYTSIYFDGKIDDVRIYDRALSTEEIWQLYLPGAGPVSHWKFDEGSGTTAYDSAGNNDGTIYRAEWTTGIIAGALDFDGVDDYVSVPDDSSLDFASGQNFSVAAWFRIEAGDTSGQPILQKYSNSNKSGYALFGNSGSVSGRIAFVTWGTGEIFVLDEGEYNDGTWHYAVGVRNQYSGIIRLYIDGVEVDTNNEPTRSLANSANLRIGTNWTGNSDYHGKIDDVRIYNRALSPEEIQQLYQDGLADLVGLEIVGPDEVAENFRASYKAIAYYDDDSTRDVTDSALWAVEPNTAANIDDYGVLTTKDIVKHQSATILASYTEGEVTVEAEKTIDIFAICPTGTALQFDGVDDYVNFGDPVDGSLDFGAGDSFSIATWIKVSKNTTMIIKRRVVSGTYYEGYVFRVSGSYSSAYFAIEDTGSLTSLVIGETPVTDNEWHHVVAVRDTGEDKLYVYVDGVSATTPVTDTTTTTLATTQEFWIGRTPYYNYFFNGIIDDVRIYNRALSAEEIQANMHTRLAGDEPGLVGYWDFDEGEGQIVYDLSGNGNDGHLGSTPEADSSDPAWVKSYAPVGICTPYQIATMAIDRAVGRKLEMLEELLGTLAEEWTAYEALEELLESGDYGDLNKGDIVTAKQKIHSATQHEEQVIDALEKSIEKLKDALSTLGYEPEPPVPNQPPNVNITNPQDGAEFGASQTIEIWANAWDVDGSVVKVEFFADESKIGEDNDGTDGWKTNWYDHPVGTYSLTAKATDNDGAATTSPPIGITVIEEPGPKPLACFPADTGVWVDGELVQISKVSSGQKVGKFDGTGATACLKQIEKVEEHEGTFECYDIVLETGNCISVADSHLFLVKSGQWKRVENLQSGSKLKSLQGLINIRSVTKRAVPFTGKVYNLKVKDGERYLVGKDGVIVRDW